MIMDGWLDMVFGVQSFFVGLLPAFNLGHGVITAMAGENPVWPCTINAICTAGTWLSTMRAWFPIPTVVLMIELLVVIFPFAVGVRLAVWFYERTPFKAT